MHTFIFKLFPLDLFQVSYDKYSNSNEELIFKLYLKIRKLQEIIIMQAYQVEFCTIKKMH